LLVNNAKIKKISTYIEKYKEVLDTGAAMENTPQPVPANRGGPPIPRGAFKLVNPIMKLLLSSPLHGLMSSNLMLLKFSGRKTGRRISVPVGYVRQENHLIVFTFGKWWRNLQNNAEVTLRLQGKDMKGRANVVSDLHTIADMINMVVDIRGPEMATRLGFERVPKDASLDEIRKRTLNLVFMQIDI